MRFCWIGLFDNIFKKNRFELFIYTLKERVIIYKIANLRCYLI